jgi:large conductance mechanosensitive channel
VIIGAAFGKIVDSLVNDIIMPFIGAIGGADFSNYFFGLSHAVVATNLVDAKKQGPVFAYGNFMTVAVNFITIAFVLFLVVKDINSMKKPAPAAPAAPPPRDEVVLLTQIRDALCHPRVEHRRFPRTSTRQDRPPRYGTVDARIFGLAAG